MHFTRSILLAALATFASAYQNAVYWGQNDNERDLAAYCASGQGIDILLLAFISNFGDGTYPNGNFGDCTVNSDQSYSGCNQLASDISTCQAAGIQVFLSIGGSAADNTWYLTGTDDATGVAYALWNSYANPDVTASGSSRPFGDVTIDGWDFDIESQGGSGYPDSYEYLGDLVNALRDYFDDDDTNTYYISGAPQCPTPDANMNNAIQTAQFDYLWIQFYNNNCSAADLFKNPNDNPNGAGTYNFNAWPGTVSGGASANAKLHVGLPGAKDAATTYDYIPTADLPSLVSQSQGVAGFNGIMVYDAGASDEVNVNGCNYAQEVHSVLTTGNTC